MSSHRGASGDPRSLRGEAATVGAAGASADARGGERDRAAQVPLALRWDGATPPPQRAPDAEPTRCHACDEAIDGEPAGHGLLLFVRGDTIEREQPPLCERCGLAIGMTALWDFLDEEEG